MTNATQSIPTAEQQRRRAASSRRTLLLLLAVCVAPVLASYLTYYVIRPQGRTNYADLITPQAGLEAFGAVGLASAGLSADAVRAALQGKWLLLTADDGSCAGDCADRLYAIRQVRLTTGKDRDRVERVLVLTGAARPDPALLAEHDGLLLLQADAAEVKRLFPTPDGGRPDQHIYLIDPLGQLVLRFPKSADPNRMKKDLARLLRASRIG